MILFVSPSLDEYLFFSSVLKESKNLNYRILTTEPSLKNKDDTLFVDLIELDSISIDNKELNELCDFYSMSCSEIFSVDRFLINSEHIDSCRSFVYSKIHEIKNFILKNNINCIYIGCGPEIVRLISYFLADKYNIKIFMHAYYGVKNKVVYFNNPKEYKLIENNNHNIFIDEYQKLEPEYLNDTWFKDVVNGYKKIKKSDIKGVKRLVKAFSERRIRNIRYKFLVKEGIYKDISQLKNINNKKILLPLHLFDDFVLTVINRKFLNQTQIVKEISDVLFNSNVVLVIKEHPADIAGYRKKMYMDLSECPNIVFCDPYLDSTAVLNECDILMTFCSTYAVESMFNNKPVLLLGQSFYKQFNFCYNVNDIDELLSIINSIHNESFKNKKDNFNKAIDKLNKNSFDAPFPYLRGDIEYNKKCYIRIFENIFGENVEI